MRRAQKLLELFNNLSVHPIRKIKIGNLGMEYSARLDIGSDVYNLGVRYYSKTNLINVFWTKNYTQSRDPNSESERAQQEIIMRIFSTLFYMVDVAIRENDVKFIEFSSEGKDAKKIRLYNILVKKLANKYNGIVSSGYHQGDFMYRIKLQSSYSPWDEPPN